MAEMLLKRLAGEAEQARTKDGEVYLVKLLRERDGERLEAYERLGRAVPFELLSIPGTPTIEELGEEWRETPWVVVLHNEGATLVPLTRFNIYTN